jgi:hypothetical protein
MMRRRKETRQSARLTMLRMSVAQAKDSLRERLHAIRSAYGTVLSTTVTRSLTSIVKALRASRFGLALLKQVFSVDSPTANCQKRKLLFVYARPAGDYFG